MNQLARTSINATDAAIFNRSFILPPFLHSEPRSSGARVTHSHASSYCSSRPLVGFCLYGVRAMCLGFCSHFTDCLFVARFVDRACHLGCLRQTTRKEVAISVFVEDQFALGRCGVGLASWTSKRAEVEPSALLISMTVRSVLSRHVDEVLARGNLAFPAWN